MQMQVENTVEPVKIVIKDYISDQDFRKLISRCIQYPSSDGGGYYRPSAEGKVFLAHPSRIRGIKQILGKLGIDPIIHISPKAETSIDTVTGEKKKMQVEMTVVENGTNVRDERGVTHFVPNLNVDMVWDIMAQRKSIKPREMWGLLAIRHNLFPELEEAAQIVNRADIPQAKKDNIVNALYEHRAGAFEGRRVRKMSDPDTETTNYYSGYWFVVLLLKKKGLIQQEGTGELELTEKGKAFAQTGKSWKEAVVEVS